MTSAVAHIRTLGPKRRQHAIVQAISTAYPDLMRADPAAWRGKFRKMSATAFAFYRGSAALFYADMAHESDSFTNEKTGRVWIQGDLHAANFGTYMNSAGLLVFDVNDFDEAYVGPFTWDLKRLAASLTLIGYEKALSDEEIGTLIESLARSYASQVAKFAGGQEHEQAHKQEHGSEHAPARGRDQGIGHSEFALTLSNTNGRLLEVLRSARLYTRIGMLDSVTTIENVERRFSMNSTALVLDAETRRKVEEAFERYLETIPPRKRFSKFSYHIKDIVGRRGLGIGSAGLPSYSILVEGPTQALENDIVIWMKQSIPAAPSRTMTDPAIAGYFKHDAHRTVISQRALQAYADPWLGYTEIDGVGQLVTEFSPYAADLDWSDIDDVADMLPLVDFLGQAVAKIHCVSDIDSDQTLVPFSTDEAIHAVLVGREDEFARDLTEFGQHYGAVVREDHELFVDAFRNGMFAGI
jgi:uncharacterized protein (DUF2252 family)